jgi:hypothetical protein
MAEAYIIRVTTEIVVGGERVPSFWVVLADSHEDAATAVRDRVSPACVVEPTGSTLGPETTSALGLQPGHARQL